MLAHYASRLILFSRTTASFLFRYRAHVIAAAFLVYLNVARLVLGGLDARAVAVGACFAALLQAVYLFNMLCDAPEDAVNAPGAAPSPAQRRAIAAAAAVLAAAPLLYLRGLPRLLPPYAAVAVALGFLYSYPFGPRGFRLKANAWTKTATAVLCYHAVLVVVPVLLKGPLGLRGYARLAAASPDVLAVIAAYLWMNDMRDVAGDAAAGVRTFPVVAGVPAAAAAGTAVCAAAAAAVLPHGGWPRALFPATTGLMCAACLRLPPRAVIRAGLVAQALLSAALLAAVGS